MLSFNVVLLAVNLAMPSCSIRLWILILMSTISDSVDCLSPSISYYFTKFTSHLPSTVMK
jgi:hypothetical protein